MSEELEHCQNCDDVGYYAIPRMIWRPIFDENGVEVGGVDAVEPEQVQCEWCWTTHNSYFNATRKGPA